MDQQRIVLVTGANRGLGLEVSRQLARQDFTVVMGGRDLERVAAAAAGLSTDLVIPRALDVTDDDSVAAAVEWVHSRFGRIDVLVNNAAVHYDTWQTATTADMQTAAEALDTNVLGAWRLAKAVAPVMKRQRRGVIVNVSSGGGAFNSIGAGTPAYSVSKAALNALTLSLAADLAKHRVLVNAVCPGWVATDMGGLGGRPVEDGARGIVWAATLGPDAPSGGFFRDGVPLSWMEG